jgi:hypothetical protein
VGMRRTQALRTSAQEASRRMGSVQKNGDRSNAGVQRWALRVAGKKDVMVRTQVLSPSHCMTWQVI